VKVTFAAKKCFQQKNLNREKIRRRTSVQSTNGHFFPKKHQTFFARKLDYLQSNFG
jgi:hypothetical protein